MLIRKYTPYILGTFTTNHIKPLYKRKDTNRLNNNETVIFNVFMVLFGWWFVLVCEVFQFLPYLMAILIEIG